MAVRHHHEITVDTVAYRWGATSMEERAPRQRVENAFSLRMNARALMLGDDPQSIRARVTGDIALAAARFGEQEAVRWADAQDGGAS